MRGRTAFVTRVPYHWSETGTGRIGDSEFVPPTESLEWPSPQQSNPPARPSISRQWPTKRPRRAATISRATLIALPAFASLNQASVGKRVRNFETSLARNERFETGKKQMRP